MDALTSSEALVRFAGACSLALLLGVPAPAEDLPPRYQAVARKGLEYLVSQQHRDGHWESNGQYPVAMTGLSGLALLLRRRLSVDPTRVSRELFQGLF